MLSVTMLICLYVLALVILVRLPSHFLVLAMERTPNRISPGIGQRILGIVLVGLGLFLSLPGVPGPGLLLVVLGLVLLGVASPESFVRVLLRHPNLLDRIDRLRHRFGRPPLDRPF